MISSSKDFLRLVFFLILFVSFQSVASDLSYSYIEAAYIESDIDVDGIDVDGDGYIFAASADFADNIAAFISYEDQEFDFDFDGEALSIGIDFHTPISHSADLVVSFAYVDVEISQPSLGKEDDTGNVIQIGFRNRISQTTEFGAFVSRTDVFDDTETSYGFNLLLGRADGVQLDLGLGKGDDTDTILVGVRANY